MIAFFPAYTTCCWVLSSFIAGFFAATALLIAMYEVGVFAFIKLLRSSLYAQLFCNVILTISSLFLYWWMTYNKICTIRDLYNPSETSFFPYFLFIMALSVTMHTDAQVLLISRRMTLALIPIGWILAHYNLLPINSLLSIIGSMVGFSLLWITGYLSNYFTGNEGIGQGDKDLLAFIGAFLGPLGCWNSLLFGSLLGAIFGIIKFLIYYIKKQEFSEEAHLLPFGTFLALGACITLYVHYEHVPYIYETLCFFTQQ